MALNSIHPRLLVKDYQACLHFYRDILGLEVIWEDGDYASFQDGGFRLAIFKREMMAEAIKNTNKPVDIIGQDGLALIFEVEDVDICHRNLKEKGVQFLEAPQDFMDWGIRAAYFRDPDGNLIEINSGIKSTKDL
jgi:catechol 2,3-dioxygenase-like lactoylglutathione lyase family enzyme